MVLCLAFNYRANSYGTVFDKKYQNRPIFYLPVKPMAMKQMHYLFMNCKLWLMVILLSLCLPKVFAGPVAAGGGGGNNKTATASSTDTPDDDEDSVKVIIKKSKLKFEFDYLSNATYLGHRNDVPEPEYSPLLRYTTTQKFYYQANFVNALGASNFYFDELDATVGKIFKFTPNWDGQLYYTRYFFSSYLDQLKAAIQSDAVASIGYDYDLLETSVSFDWSHGNNTYKTKKNVPVNQQLDDYTAIFTNNHIFIVDDFLHKGNDLTIIPQVDVLIGTQNYLMALRGLTPPPKPPKPIKPNLPVLPATATKAQKTQYKKDSLTYIANEASYEKDEVKYESAESTYSADVQYNKFVSEFNVTGVILTLSLSYDIGNFSIGVAPYYTFPFNLPAGELSNPYFVMAASVYYTFKFPHLYKSQPVIK